MACLLMPCCPIPSPPSSLSQEVARLLVDHYGPQANPAQMTTLQCEDIASLLDVVSQTDAIYLGIVGAAREGIVQGRLVELGMQIRPQRAGAAGLITWRAHRVARHVGVSGVCPKPPERLKKKGIGMQEWLYPMGVVLLGYTVLGLTGFGSALVVVPLLAWKWPLPAVVALTLLMDVPASAFHSGLNWRQVQWRELRRLLPGMVLGTLVGLWLVQHMNSRWPLLLLGVYVAGVGLNALRPRAAPLQPPYPFGLGRWARPLAWWKCCLARPAPWWWPGSVAAWPMCSNCAPARPWSLPRRRPRSWWAWPGTVACPAVTCGSVGGVDRCGADGRLAGPPRGAPGARGAFAPDHLRLAGGQRFDAGAGGFALRIFKSKKGSPWAPFAVNAAMVYISKCSPALSPPRVT
jgi:hypothetical protein